jgi:Carboxypeptidase regulatory-like domain
MTHKPVLHGGEVSTTSSSINGKVLDQGTGNPVSGQVIVALEQKDASGVDRAMMSTLAGADGAFVFCPIPAGTYDVVIVGERTDGTAYQPSVVTSVTNGQTVGNVSLHIGTAGALGAANFSGGVTSQNASTAGTVADIEVNALETDSGSGTTFTIPLLPNAQQPSATLALETAASSGCAAGTDCANYSMTLPAGGPYIGAYAASGLVLTQNSPLATYVVDGLAVVPSSGGVADCSPSEQKSQPYALSNSFNVPVQTLAFSQCQ